MTASRLRRDITAVLILKLALLSALYLLFFRGDQRPAIDDIYISASPTGKAFIKQAVGQSAAPAPLTAPH